MLVQEMMQRRIAASTNIPVKEVAPYWELTSALAALVAAVLRVESLPKQKLKITPKETEEDVRLP